MTTSIISTDLPALQKFLARNTNPLKDILSARLDNMTVILSSNSEKELQKILKLLNGGNGNLNTQEIIKGIEYAFEELDKFVLSQLHKTRKHFIEGLKMNFVSQSPH